MVNKIKHDSKRKLIEIFDDSKKLDESIIVKLFDLVLNSKGKKKKAMFITATLFIILAFGLLFLIILILTK